MQRVDFQGWMTHNHVSRAVGLFAMGYPFPSEAWLYALQDVLNSDKRYAEVASNWEGDLLVVIEPDGESSGSDLPMTFYLDLWHGRCRGVRVIQAGDELPQAAFSMNAKLGSILRIFQGELDPMQAMLTRRLQVQGNMAYMLRNVPTVLDFVRCCRKVEIESV
jgi:putative sterol carrier protein